MPGYIWIYALRHIDSHLRHIDSHLTADSSQVRWARFIKQQFPGIKQQASQDSDPREKGNRRGNHYNCHSILLKQSFQSAGQEEGILNPVVKLT